MYLEQLPIFKELTPYSGQIDRKNRWIKLAELVLWNEMDMIYRRYFDEGKQSIIKSSRLILGLMLGQMLFRIGVSITIRFLNYKTPAEFAQNFKPTPMGVDYL